jgi:hypothetical protein
MPNHVSAKLNPGTPPPQSSHQQQFNDHIIHEENKGVAEEIISQIKTPDLRTTFSIDESLIVESSQGLKDKFMPRHRI